MQRRTFSSWKHNSSGRLDDDRLFLKARNAACFTVLCLYGVILYVREEYGCNVPYAWQILFFAVPVKNFVLLPVTSRTKDDDNEGVETPASKSPHNK